MWNDMLYIQYEQFIFIKLPLGFCRSEKGAIHIWNLNTRRAQKIIEGHSGSSILWVNTLQATDTLIR